MWLPSGNSTDSDKVYLSKTLQGTRGNYSNGSSIDQNTTIALVSRRILDQKSLDTFIADATLRYQKLHQGKKDEIKTALTELTADITIDPTTGHLIYSPRDNTKQLTLGHNVYNNEEVISIRGFQTNSIFLDDMLRTAAELPRRQDDAIILLLNSNRVRDYNGTQGVVPISTADVRSYLARENYSLR